MGIYLGFLGFIIFILALILAAYLATKQEIEKLHIEAFLKLGKDVSNYQCKKCRCTFFCNKLKT